jgi:hypothetical protein
MLTVVTDPEATPAGPASSVSLIDEIVLDGATFKRGKLVERNSPTAQAQAEAA